MRAIGYGRITYDELTNPPAIDASPSTLPFSFEGVDDVENYLPQSTATINVRDIGTDRALVTVAITWKNTTYESKISTASLSAIITNVE